jgi:hypothetical protein
MSKVNNDQIDQLVKKAEQIVRGNYDTHEPTAKNHAALQGLEIKVTGELIKTIRALDAKNSKLQKTVLWLSIVATVSALIALFK